jgi:hypothetical protein
VLAVHALIAAAGDPQTTPAQARAIDTAYLSISALSTMLDSIIDYEHDLDTGRPWYLQRYEDRSLLAYQLTHVARDAARQASTLPNPAHHIMTLVGVVAYYTSASSHSDEFVQPLITHIQRELQPLITPTLAVMRAWRIAKRLHSRYNPAATRGPESLIGLDRPGSGPSRPATAQGRSEPAARSTRRHRPVTHESARRRT